MLPADAVSIRSIAFFLGLAVFLGLELWRPYRGPSQPKGLRWFNNLGMTLINNIVLSLTVGSLVAASAVYAQTSQTGLWYFLGLSYPVRFVLTILVFDFIIYVWHLLNHEMPLMWRFHRVHHSDLNMDVSTATRFHLGELIPSVFIKVGLIFMLGADLASVVAFETLVVLASQFHHSSIEISPRAERYIWPLFVPPSMHRIHHSVKIKERDSNYGVLLSIWDRAFGTMVSGVDQEKIRIGVGGHFNPRKLKLHHLFTLPFSPYRR